MSLENIITQLATLEATITGVEVAHDETPESLSELPCFINIPREGTIDWNPAEKKYLHTIFCDLHVSRSVSEEAELAARPFIKRFGDMLVANDTLNGSVDTINEVRYYFMTFPMSLTEEHFGVRFEVHVKETESK